MTQGEAIKVLKNTVDNINYDKNRDEIYFTHEWVGAYEMAISALREQVNVVDFDQFNGCKYCTKGCHKLTTVTYEIRTMTPATNADHIRSMTDEELAVFLMELMFKTPCFGEGVFPYHPCPQEQNCRECGLDWLKQPYKEDT